MKKMLGTLVNDHRFTISDGIKLLGPRDDEVKGSILTTSFTMSIFFEFRPNSSSQTLGNPS